jgi:hypothetical protein
MLRELKMTVTKSEKERKGASYQGQKFFHFLIIAEYIINHQSNESLASSSSDSS